MKLLTAIMFKSALSTKHLPTVNYLTSLDKYSISSLIFIYSCLVWHGTVATLLCILSPLVVQFIDKVVLVLLVLFFIITHMVFAKWLRSAYKIRQRMIERDEEFSSLENSTNLNSTRTKQLEQKQDSLALLNNNVISPKPLQHRMSIFNTIDNIDQINYFYNSHRHPSFQTSTNSLKKTKNNAKIMPL